MLKNAYNKIEDFLCGAASMGPQWYAIVIVALFFSAMFYIFSTMG